MEEEKKETIIVDENPVVDEQTINLPSSVYAHTFRLGKIFFRISLTCFILLFVCSLGCVLTPLAQAMFMICLLCVMLLMIIFTLGMVFAIESKPMARMWEFFENVSQSTFSISIANFLFSLLPYLSIVGISSAILSIVLLACTRTKKSVGKIVALSIFIPLMIIPLLFYYLMGGVLWQN